MRRFLVTGASGFLGRHLVRVLRGAGRGEVVAPPRGVDLLDRDATRQAFSGTGKVDYVLHAADVGGDARWAADHAGTQMLSNSRMALNLLEAWRDLQPQARLVGFSSLWAYPERVVEAHEEAYWDGRMHVPTEHYGLGKKLLGVGIQAMRREHGLSGTMLVLGNVYGPGDTSTRVIPSLIRRMRSSPARLEVWGDGTETRDFVYVDDQVEGVLQHLDSDAELLNVTTGVYFAIRDVVSTLSRLMDYGGEVVYQAGKGAGVARRRVDVSKAGKLTGWPGNHQLHTLEEGLRKTLDSLAGDS
jgi:GDP-L-fucose synthase